MVSKRVRAYNVRVGDVLPWLNLKTRREVRYTVADSDQSFPGVVQLRLRGSRGAAFRWNMKRTALVVVLRP